MEDQFLKVAKEAALEAGEFIANLFGNQGALSFKEGDTSNITTKADLGAQDLIIKAIQKSFPDHNIIAEEQVKINKDSIYTWVIDPLDGTTSFASGVPIFGVSIGLLKNNKPFLGVINWIIQKELYWAQENLGAYLNGKKISVSKKDKLTEAVLGFEVGTRKYREQKYKSYVAPLFYIVRYPYFLGSSAITLVLMSKGVLDGILEQAWLWDFVAGAIIIREAGGKVTDFEGQEPDWTKERLNIVASNGLIHNQILEALKR